MKRIYLVDSENVGDIWVPLLVASQPDEEVIVFYTQKSLDGHIGFNEPADHFEKNTHCVELTESTIEANKRFFESKDEVPRQAYTMGILPIVQAKKVIMIANGKNKADIIKKAFTGPVTPEVPASILQMHPDFTLIADEDALSEI